MLQYPDFIADIAPFLPRIDLNCVRRSGIQYLDGTDSTHPAAVTDFVDAIAEGCSSDAFTLLGGYNSASEQLEINIVVNLGASRNL